MEDASSVKRIIIYPTPNNASKSFLLLRTVYTILPLSSVKSANLDMSHPMALPVQFYRPKSGVVRFTKMKTLASNVKTTMF
jgi:hypothetical protein